MDAKDIYERTTRHLLAPIVPFIDNDDVSEIMVVGYKDIYIEKSGQVEKADNVRFESEKSLLAAVRNIAEFAGRRIDEFHHSLDARLPNGSRVHAIIPPAARHGICLTIRKFQREFRDLALLLDRDESIERFLSTVVQMKKNIVISGGTGTGKTTMLNALSSRIPENERIIVIEDSSELELQQSHTIYLESQTARADGCPAITIRDLFADSLRMRPDRIIVGEVRRGESLDLIQSMISGHPGSMTTVHADTPRDAVSRLETLCLFSDADLPILVARTQVASAVHLVVQLSRLAGGSRRVMEIAECEGLSESGDYVFNDLYRFEGQGLAADGTISGSLKPTGNRPSFEAQASTLGFELANPDLLVPSV